MTRRLGGANLADERPRWLGKFERLTPGLKIILAEHGAPPQEGITPDDPLGDFRGWGESCNPFRTEGAATNYASF
jgi:hypothetical protein